MWRINARILRSRVTLITNFMCDSSASNKTFDELVNIFEDCKDKFTPETDPSDDLRILKFVEDMKNGQWTDSILIHSDNGEVKDGVHRGISYLICINDGVSKSNLPEVLIDEHVID